MTISLTLTVIPLMTSLRAFNLVPDCAIFADTRSEPPSIASSDRTVGD